MQLLPDAEGFIRLFDGTTLNGWHGDTSAWSVEAGKLIGSADAEKEDFNLITDDAFSHFILKLRYRLSEGNSGVRFRCEDRSARAMAGYEADISAVDRKNTGNLFDALDKRRMLVRAAPKSVRPSLDRALNRGGWNHYTITANGHHIVSELNGVKSVETYDPQGPLSGHIALNLRNHRTTEIAFTDLKIRLLPAGTN